MKNFINYKAFVLVSFILYFLTSSAQDPNYSQFYSNPIYYNPSFAGISTGIRVCANYRNLWPKIQGDFNTFNFSVDVEESNVSGGLGIIAHRSSEGDGTITSTTIGAAYSYRLIVNPRNLFFQLGLMGAYAEKSLNQDNLVFSDQLDPINGNVYPTKYQNSGKLNVSYPDFSAGVLTRFNSGKVLRGKPGMTTTIGLAFHHISQPNQSFIGMDSKLPIRTVFHANSLIPVRYDNYRKEFLLTPAIIYENQSPMETFTIGTNFVVNPIYAGIWLRNRNFEFSGEKYDAIIMTIGLNALTNRSESHFNLCYSYDLTISKLSSASGGTHEVSLKMQFENFKLMKSRKYSKYRKKALPCYHF